MFPVLGVSTVECTSLAPEFGEKEVTFYGIDLGRCRGGHLFVGCAVLSAPGAWGTRRVRCWENVELPSCQELCPIDVLSARSFAEFAAAAAPRAHDLDRGVSFYRGAPE